MPYKFAFLLPWAYLIACTLSAQNNAPSIQHFSVSVDWATNTLEVRYDVSDLESDPLDVALAFSLDGGQTFGYADLVPAAGDVGYPVLPGTNRQITCDISALAGLANSFIARLVVDDRMPFDLQGLVNAVDSNRLRADLTFVEGIRHRTTGLAHLNAVRDSMRHAFETLGLHALEHSFLYSGYTGRNVVGSFPGTTLADTVVVVDAHYDTVNNAPGADDNGSGVVGVLEAARLLSRYPAKKSLRYIGFDLEEAGLIGSTRYVATGIPIGETIQGVFNFEMIGYYTEEPNTQQLPAGFGLLFPAAAAAVAANGNRGDFITNVGHAQSPAIAQLFESSAAQFVPDLRVITVLEPVGIPVPDLRRSDHAPFWGAGIPALMLTDGANFRNPCYHTPHDTLDEKLNFTFMANVVKATVAAAAQLAEIQHGDWATAPFEGTVRTRHPRAFDCAATVTTYPHVGRRIALRFGECPLETLHLAVYNAQGALCHQEVLPAPAAHSQHVLQTPELAPGMYVVRLHAVSGSLALKIPLY